jgi:hypothetical protein
MIVLLLGLFWLLCLLAAVALCKAAGDADRRAQEMCECGDPLCQGGPTSVFPEKEMTETELWLP